MKRSDLPIQLRNIAVVLLFALSITQAGPVFSADPIPASFQMSVILDRAHGEVVSAGNYSKAILRINGDHERFPFATNTNLCVAHTMVGQFKHATRYCDEALRIAEQEASTGRRKDRDYTKEWVIAFSNRGVLRARMGKFEAAAADFRAAIDLHGGSEQAVSNLAKLNESEHEAIAARR